MSVPIWFWIAFNVFILAMLALDLGVFNRKEHIPTFKESAAWISVWVSLALIFNVGIYFYMGSEKALQFLSGYLIEQSLSADNIFIFVLVFSFFKVPRIHQHRILFWGIIGALVMRGIMIGVGSILLQNFHWIIYIFGVFLIYTGVRMAFHDESEVEPGKNPVLRFARRIFPIAEDHKGKEFFIRRNGALMATPLFLVLIVVETTDLIFAIDSIPAIFAITDDPFIVYTSNVFAILGLRSLYFVLANLVDKFYYLRFALAFILSFVGIKMLLPLAFEILHYFHIISDEVDFKLPTWVSLVVIVVTLTVAVIASIIRNKRMPNEDVVEEKLEEMESSPEVTLEKETKTPQH